MVKRIAVQYLGVILGFVFIIQTILITSNDYLSEKEAFEIHVLDKTYDIILKSTISLEKLQFIKGGAVQDLFVWDNKNDLIKSTNDTLAAKTQITGDSRTGGWEIVEEYPNALLYVKALPHAQAYGILINKQKIHISFWRSLWLGLKWASFFTIVAAGFFVTFVFIQRSKLKTSYASLLAYFTNQHKELNGLFYNSESLNRTYDSHLEELSTLAADMEVINELTQDNADKTIEANRISDEISTSTSMGTVTVHSLNESMENISASMEKTTTIIKAIDEIAFQTNILAVNASVEAARAGQAGAGFAVVADEVRRLAMKTTDAARETSVILEQAQTYVSDGQKVTEEVSDVFHEIDAKTVTVYKILSKLTNSVQEQQQRMLEIKYKISNATQFGSNSQHAITEINQILQLDIDQFEKYHTILSDLNDQISLSKEELDSIKGRIQTQVDWVRNWSEERFEQIKSLTTKAKSE
ncbi:hypothetical protein EP331_00670 [bacterium]|nr:MAG: hypothetical protein EP331_00670 [bacterium]